MAKAKTVINLNPACPRCRTTDTKQLRRGSLKNRSTFLPVDQRGKTESKRVKITCMHCGYEWRSERQDVKALQELTAAEAKKLEEDAQLLPMP